MTASEPQLREQLEKALAEINRSLEASTKSRDLVERFVWRVRVGCSAWVGRVESPTRSREFMYEESTRSKLTRREGYA